jgi:erythromycin esterase-like protein
MGSISEDARIASAIAHGAHPLVGARDDFDPLLERIGEARIVFIGEASHGTHEFYRRRAELTARLISEKGFVAVATEADWPDSYRVNRFIRGLGADVTAEEALEDFKRFPQWMWRNADVLDFVGWLRTYNEQASQKVGFYGLDLYSLHSSMAAVLSVLDRRDPQAARRARERYSCFEQFGPDAEVYGQAVALGLSSCEGEVIAQLLELQQRQSGDEEHFAALQNARVVRDAERYYRAMLGDPASSWNLRDTHMADTLDALLEHLQLRTGGSKVVVWAHNSHVGDARGTQLGELGELTMGQLARERHPGLVRLIGQSTWGGTVTAASDWGGPAERKGLRPGVPGSCEALFHDAGIPAFALFLDELGEAAGALREPRLQRAIGVIYRPQTERQSHYFFARLPMEFDALLHFDRTRALEPLERTAAWVRGEAPETYPTGI